MKKILFMAVLVLSSSFAQAENWVVITKSPDGGVTQYLDLDSVEHYSGLVEMWRIFEYKAPYLRQVNRKSYTSQKVHTAFDCTGRAMRQISFTWNEGSMGTGEVLYEVKEPDVWLIDQFDEFTLPLWEIACGDWEKNQ